MYNCYQARQKTFQITKKHEKQQLYRHWEENYIDKVQPKLLQRYNKRINTFIRKMEEHPLCIADTQKITRNNQEINLSAIHGKKRFIYKDQNDWISLLTQSQRIDREFNIKYMRRKFGSEMLANRSFISQSVYNPKVQYRTREKVKQINPPMIYSHKLKKKQTQSIRISKRIHTLHEKTSKNLSRNPQNQNSAENKRKNSVSSLNVSSLFFHEELKSNTDESLKQHIPEQVHQSLLNMHTDDKRMYFKKIVDLQNKLTDQQQKKILRELLIRCGVYKLKDCRMKLDSQIDRLSQLDNKSLTRDSQIV